LDLLYVLLVIAVIAILFRLIQGEVFKTLTLTIKYNIMKSDKIILGVLGGVAVGALLGFVCT
jgi:uncharacterized membrane protein